MSRISSRLLAAFVLGVGTSWAQPHGRPVQDAGHATGLEVSVRVVRLRPEPVTPLESGASLRSGARFVIEARADRPFYAYTIQFLSNGRSALLHETADDAPLPGETMVRLPGPEQYFTSGNNTADVQLYVVLSSRPIDRADSVLADLVREVRRPSLSGPPVDPHFQLRSLPAGGPAVPTAAPTLGPAERTLYLRRHRVDRTAELVADTSGAGVYPFTIRRIP